GGASHGPLGFFVSRPLEARHPTSVIVSPAFRGHSAHRFAGVFVLRPILVAALTCLVLAVPAQGATLEQMAGQMIVIGFEGDGAGDASVKAIAGELAAGRLG